IRHFMELRGIGVINARRMFGMRAVKITEKISLIIQLELWQDDKPYDRLGVENEYMQILGIKIPAVTIPVKPGRNLAVIIEAATMNLRLKKLGYHPARELMKALGMPEDELPPAEKIIGNTNWDIE
ncbi:MAG: HPr kinase/phosphorylase, partial [Oscillospiraceae bacterium]